MALRATKTDESRDHALVGRPFLAASRLSFRLSGRTLNGADASARGPIRSLALAAQKRRGAATDGQRVRAVTRPRPGERQPEWATSAH